MLRRLIDRAHAAQWEEPVEIQRAVAAAIDRVAVRAVDREVTAGARFETGGGIVRARETAELLGIARQQRRNRRRALIRLRRTVAHARFITPPPAGKCR